MLLQEVSRSVKDMIMEPKYPDEIRGMLSDLQRREFSSLFSILGATTDLIPFVDIEWRYQPPAIYLRGSMVDGIQFMIQNNGELSLVYRPPIYDEDLKLPEGIGHGYNNYVASCSSIKEVPKALKKMVDLRYKLFGEYTKSDFSECPNCGSK